VDHHELLLVDFGCDDLESDPLQVVAEEERALVRSIPEPLIPATFDHLKTAPVDDMKSPLSGDAVLRR
jgi:hypothetical protein